MGDLFFSDCRLFWYFHTPLPPLQADNGALIAHWQRLPGFGELLPPPALLPCVAAFTCSDSSGSETSKGGGDRGTASKGHHHSCVSASLRLHTGCMSVRCPPAWGTCQTPVSPLSSSQGKAYKAFPFSFCLPTPMPRHEDAQLWLLGPRSLSPRTHLPRGRKGCGL